MSSSNMLLPRLYDNQPPPPQTKAQWNPTLLVSWWCTGFALAAILVRVCGRYVRTEKLFPEDKIACLSIIPLMGRMALVHVILIWGTNNTTTQGMTPLEIRHREIGSKLILAERILYAGFIWTAKLAVLELLKRLVGAYWRKSYQVGLLVIRYFLLVTYTAVVIATLVECRPFHHYWQVIPDPGPRCREGLVQLITMGSCDIVTDLLLVIYPIPIVLASGMTVKRKVSLTMLFALSLGLVGITAYRIPAVIFRKSSQQRRSLLASFEVLAAATVSNAIVIGSFIRDRGAKKAKYKTGSTTESPLDQSVSRIATLTMHHWGSDADLAADLGMSLHPDLRFRPAPVASSLPHATTAEALLDPRRPMDANWKFAQAAHEDHAEDSSTSSVTADSKLTGLEAEKLAEPNNPTASGERTSNKISFFDVGTQVQRHDSLVQSPVRDSAMQESRSSSRAFIADVGGLLSPLGEENSMDRSTALPPASRSASRQSATPRAPRNFSRRHSTLQSHSSISGVNGPAPSYRPGHDMDGPADAVSGVVGRSSLDFVDAGGLLR